MIKDIRSDPAAVRQRERLGEPGGLCEHDGSGGRGHPGQAETLFIGALQGLTGQITRINDSLFTAEVA